MRSYFSHGKVLLCGEYAVLGGVEALALPVKTGQWLKVWEVPTAGNSKIIWQGVDHTGKAWFDCRIDTEIMHVSESTDEEIAKTLVQLLRYIEKNRKEFFLHKTIRIETTAEFDRSWGLGTSSTLVNTLASWTGVDPFELQRTVFGGSGYDVAVAVAGKPLLYWLEGDQPNWEPWHLDAQLTANWFLAFPGNKQNSRSSMAELKPRLDEMKIDPMILQQLNACVNAIKNPRSIPLLEAMLEMYQALLAQYLEIPKAYDDLKIQPIQGGLCKWLGAWGGDMLLVNQKVLSEYSETFASMQVVPWNEMVIGN